MTPEQVSPGATFVARLVADSVSASGDSTCPGIDAFACSARLPVGLSVSSAAWGSAVSDHVSGDYNTESLGVEGLEVGAAGYLSQPLDPGFSRELLRLELVVSSDLTSEDELEFEFDDAPDPVFMTTLCS